MTSPYRHDRARMGLYYGMAACIVCLMVAAVIGPEDFELLQKEKERAFGVVDRVQAKNTGHDPDEILSDITEAVEDVRIERHARRPQPGWAS